MPAGSKRTARVDCGRVGCVVQGGGRVVVIVVAAVVVAVAAAAAQASAGQGWSSEGNIPNNNMAVECIAKKYRSPRSWRPFQSYGGEILRFQHAVVNGDDIEIVCSNCLSLTLHCCFPPAGRRTTLPRPLRTGC